MAYRNARKKAGLTMKEVAKILGVSRTTVWLWETGKVSPIISRIKKLADLYGVTVDELLKEDPTDAG